jgi:hypothetical protein
MAITIVSVLWIEMWALSQLIGKLPTARDFLPVDAASSTIFQALLLLTPLLTLGVLLSMVHIARVLLPRERARIN